MATNDQKLRILYLMHIMLKKTDEKHILNATDLCRILSKEYGIDVDRRTIYSDINTLDSYGLNIIQLKGKNAGYYVGTRKFELPELKLLVDAVQSSKFITESKSRELINKLETLCSEFEAKQLSQQVVIYNRPKTKNETIYYNVDQIHAAIFYNKQVTFQYAEWTVKKELHLRKNGTFYIVSPWSLTWDDENYYLIAYDESEEKVKHYRVDKIQHINMLDIERKGKEYFLEFNLALYAKKTFGMYGGKDAEITLLCHNGLAGVILDRFGQDIWMIPEGENYFRTKVIVTVSRQFFGWITGIGDKIQIIAPKDIREEYKEYLQEVLLKY